MKRAQHIVPSGLIAAVGLWVCWISFTQEPADAFLFPRLISICFTAFALWTFGKAVLGLSKVGAGISMKMLAALLPGLAVMCVYVFWAAKSLGFYTATTIAFFLLLSMYDPASHREPKVWIRRVTITAGFMVVMYGLFAMLLKVFTPREVFF